MVISMARASTSLMSVSCCFASLAPDNFSKFRYEDNVVADANNSTHLHFKALKIVTL